MSVIIPNQNAQSIEHFNYCVSCGWITAAIFGHSRSMGIIIIISCSCNSYCNKQSKLVYSESSLVINLPLHFKAWNNIDSGSSKDLPTCGSHSLPPIIRRKAKHFVAIISRMATTTTVPIKTNLSIMHADFPYWQLTCVNSYSMKGSLTLNNGSRYGRTYYSTCIAVRIQRSVTCPRIRGIGKCTLPIDITLICRPVLLARSCMLPSWATPTGNKPTKAPEEILKATKLKLHLASRG